MGLNPLDGTYRPQSRAIRVVGTALLLFVFGLPTAIGIASLLGQTVFRERTGVLAIENRNEVSVIVWGTTEPTVRPTGDAYLLPTFGFVVGPNATLRLPDNRVWESAAVYSADCTLLDQVFADGAIRVIIDGTEVSVAASGSIGAYQVAKTTETCRLVPYEGPTVPPL